MVAYNSLSDIALLFSDNLFDCQGKSLQLLGNPQLMTPPGKTLDYLVVNAISDA